MDLYLPARYRVETCMQDKLWLSGHYIDAQARGQPLLNTPRSVHVMTTPRFVHVMMNPNISLHMPK